MLSSLRRPAGLALVAGLVTVASCSDSTGPNGSLTPEEINELAVQMGFGLSSDLVSSPALAPSGARFNAIPAPISASVEFTIRCPRGGTADITASVEGTIDDATESAILDVTATQDHHACGYPVHGKTVWTTTPTRRLTANAHVEVRNGEPVGTHTASLSGEFDWRTNDGRRGTCSIDYSASANYTDNRAEVNGNFCGATIQFSGPLTTN